MTTRPELASSFSAAAMAAATVGMESKGFFFADLYVDDDLRERLQVGSQLGEGFAGAVDYIENQQRGQGGRRR